MFSLIRSRVVLWSMLAAALLSGAEANALPAFLRIFSTDPFSRTEWRGQCATCHVNPQGSGPRNDFGQAFDKNGRVVTPELRAAWPDRFLSSAEAALVTAASGAQLKTTFVNSGRAAVIEINGEFFRVSAAEGKIEKIDAAQLAQLRGGAPAVAAAAPPEQPLRNQPTFDHTLVNLPTALPYSKGALSLRFTHRFLQPVLRTGDECPDCGELAELFGLDSFSYSSLGGEYGLTSRLAATVYRSPLDRNYEIGGVLQLLRQQGREPLSAAARISMETRRLFEQDKVCVADDDCVARYQIWNLVFPVSRAISNVAEVFVIPMVSFRANTFPVATGPGAAEGETREHQAALGLGASIRLRPRTAFVAEWTPRVAGYHSADSRNAFSFGLQRSTNAHVFSLVLTNTVATTTSQAVGTGTPDLRLGFNLYRRLR